MFDSSKSKNIASRTFYATSILDHTYMISQKMRIVYFYKQTE